MHSAIKSVAQVRLRNFGILGALRNSRTIAYVHPGNACRVGASFYSRDDRQFIQRAIAYRHVYQED